MRILWAAAIVGWLLLAAEAHADTVYLKDGQIVWGSETTEQGGTVIVSRPTGSLRIPRSDVIRIERAHLSIPQFYSPPAGESGPPAGGEDAVADRRPSSAGTPGAAQETAAPGAPPGSPPPGQTGGLTPTLLPPPPPRGAASPK